MTTTPPNFCPVHGDPDDVMKAWPCARQVSVRSLAQEVDPFGPDLCEHLVTFLARMLQEINVEGNYWRYFKDADGRRWKQQYINHEPHGDPQPRWGVSG